MSDNTVIIKKKNGESVILNADDSLQYIDNQGKMKAQDDYRFKLRYHYNTNDIQHQVYDELNKKYFNI